MKDVNKVILIGRLGKDPIQRSTNSGKAVTNFSLATSKKVRGDEGSGDSREVTEWHNVVAWGTTGENCARYLKKGESVYIEGEIRARKYEAKDGSPRTAYEVHADRVRFLGLGKRAEHPAPVVESCH